jgi:pSer/pThr/pTyr-binding forkhead associated (FHA) protein
MRIEMLVYHGGGRARIEGRLAGADKRYTIGRQECDCNLKDNRISRVHAALFLDRGELVVRDLSSTNGTFVNDVRVSQASLRAGDEIRVGDTLLSIVEIDWADVLPPGAVRLEAQSFPSPEPAPAAERDARTSLWDRDRSIATASLWVNPASSAPAWKKN